MIHSMDVFKIFASELINQLLIDLLEKKMLKKDVDLMLNAPKIVLYILNVFCLGMKLIVSVILDMWEKIACQSAQLDHVLMLEYAVLKIV